LFWRVVWHVGFAVDGVVAYLSRDGLPGGRNVVFVRVDNLGDFLLWLPAAQALRRAWPWQGRRFVLVANSAWSAFASDLGIFDDVIPLDVSRFQNIGTYRLQMIRRLAGLSAELAVNPTYSRAPQTSDSVVRAVNASRRIAIEGDTDNAFPFGADKPDHWYNELIATGTGLRHELLSNRDFVRNAFGLDTEPAQIVVRKADLPAQLHNIEYAVVAPGAKAGIKVWPPDRYAAVVDSLQAEGTLKTVLIGTNSEYAQLESVARSCARPPLIMAGNLNFKSLAAVIAHAKVLIGNDTGSIHLGVALRVPTVVAAGGGYFTRFADYPLGEQSNARFAAAHHPMPCFNCRWYCIYPVANGKPPPCITAISVDTVLAAVSRVLAQT
jgi:ADP-heptose:LPS heptosyltransferase